MRQNIRRILVYVSLLLFPVTMNYLSPYVSVDAAFLGIVSGSVLVFALLFLSGLFLGRAFCGWLCPVAGLSELCLTVNRRPVPVRKLRAVRYSIFGVWLAVLIAGFVLAGGVRGVNPLHLTERVVSVDEPFKYITYYFVLFIILALTLSIGRRGACHAVCWMSPFLTAGTVLGRALRLPQLRVYARQDRCNGCGACGRRCPMSIDVCAEARRGQVRSTDCILCGECVDGCPQRALSYGKRSGKRGA